MIWISMLRPVACRPMMGLVLVARALARSAVFVSHGDFYAATVARRLGHEKDGLVRAGCACYTTAEEVDRLLASLARVATSR